MGWELAYCLVVICAKYGELIPFVMVICGLYRVCTPKLHDPCVIVLNVLNGVWDSIRPCIGQYVFTLFTTNHCTFFKVKVSNFCKIVSRQSLLLILTQRYSMLIFRRLALTSPQEQRHH